MEDRKKTKEEHIKDFEKFHKKFMSNDEDLRAFDNTPFRKKKSKKTKVKRKCKK